jgi:DNA-binding NarL/FixJ family response regulator
MKDQPGGSGKRPAGSVVRVAVVDDGARLRRSIEEIIGTDPRCLCVGSHPSAEQALAELPASRPDVVIMDVNLPGLSGVDCVAKLAELLPGTHIIMLTVYQDVDTIFRALGAGAHGFLIKPVRAAELLAAIHYSESGGTPMTSVIARRVAEQLRSKPPEQAGGEPLAPREIEVLEMLVQGLAYKEIAKALGVSYFTINTHVQRIYRKLHVSSRSEAVFRYLRLSPTRAGPYPPR